MSLVSGVYPVIKKCNCGVGINGAVRPIRLLFMYDGYRSVVVLTDIIVDTSVLICAKLGFCNWQSQSVRHSTFAKNANPFYLQMEPISCDAIQCGVIQYNDAISATGQSTECQQRIVRLHNNITANGNRCYCRGLSIGRTHTRTYLISS